MNSGRKPELTPLTDDKDEAETEQQRHIDDEVRRWNAGDFSTRIGWEHIFPYLPEKGLDIVQFFELVSSADKDTYDRLAQLIQKTAAVSGYPEGKRKLLAYKYLRAGLRNFYSIHTAKIDQGIVLTRSGQETHAVLSEYFGPLPASVSRDIDKVSPPAPTGINWAKMVHLARIVFNNVESDDELMGQSTANSEKNIRDYIYGFIANKSRVRYEKILLQDSVGRQAIKVGALVSKLESLGVEYAEVFLALAARGNFITTAPVRSEPEVTEKIKAYLLRQWQKQPPGSGLRQAMAKFSIMVMADSFLPHPSYPPPLCVKPGMDTKPSLDQLRSLSYGGETINVIGRTASNYSALGRFLLVDDDGSQVKWLEMKNYYHPETVMTAIIKQWMAETPDATWRKLVRAIKRSGRHYLADMIEMALSR